MVFLGFVVKAELSLGLHCNSERRKTETLGLGLGIKNFICKVFETNSLKQNGRFEHE